MIVIVLEGVGGLFPAAAEAGVEGDDGLELLEVVVDALELGGEEVLLGGEDVGVVGFGVGFHQLFGVVDGLLEEVDLFGAGRHFVGGGLVVIEGIRYFLARGEEGLFEGEEELLFLAFGYFETLAVEAVLEDGLYETGDEVAEEGGGVEEVREVVGGEAAFASDGQRGIEICPGYVGKLGVVTQLKLRLLDVGAIGEQLSGHAYAQVRIGRIIIETIARNGTGVAAEQQADGVLGLADVLPNIGNSNFNGIEPCLALHDGGAREHVGFFEGLGCLNVLLAVLDGGQGDTQLLVIGLKGVVVGGDAFDKLGLHVAAVGITFQQCG